MNNTHTQTANEFVRTVLFCNHKNQIVGFKKIETPISESNLNYEEMYKEPFSFALTTLNSGKEIVYRITKKK
jgi:hypothetical protein